MIFVSTMIINSHSNYLLLKKKDINSNEPNFQDFVCLTGKIDVVVVNICSVIQWEEEHYYCYEHH